MQRRLVEGLGRVRDIQCRVLGEEPIWLQHHADALHWHDGEIFDARIVSEAES